MLQTGTANNKYDVTIENAVSRIEALLHGDYGTSHRSVSLFLLQSDSDIERMVGEKDADSYAAIKEIVKATRENYGQPLSYIIAMSRQQAVRHVLNDVVTTVPRKGGRFAERLSRAMMNPITGFPILLIVIYFGLYQFVGVFGAGFLVDFIESTVFGKWINPAVTGWMNSITSIQVIRDLFVGQFGIVTLGLSYAFAIILPIVGTFFIAFSIIEDSGYLPRLAMLVDRIFKAIGLNGRAVIPIVLGLGCDTMATIVTRTQETRRERIITTLLLALAIPCSAQLGVVFAILSGSPLALAIWIGVLVLILLVVGFLAAKVIPGEKTSFYMEVPPLRLPRISNVLVKTYSRLQWYLMEVLPLFVIASVVLWLGDLTGVFDIIIGWMKPLVQFIGLPPETAVAFLYGFFRRDFGAAGLYQLNSAGILVGIPLVVAAVTLTLFVPCIAQFSIMWKERGMKTALLIAGFIFPFAFLVGYLLNLALTSLGVTL